MCIRDRDSVTALATGNQFLRIVAPFYFVVSVKLVADGILRGAGMMKQFMIATFADLILRVALSIVFSKVIGLGPVGIWLSWPVGWTSGMLLSVLFYRKSPWMKKMNKEKNSF